MLTIKVVRSSIDGVANISLMLSISFASNPSVLVTSFKAFSIVRHKRHWPSETGSRKDAVDIQSSRPFWAVVPDEIGDYQVGGHTISVNSVAGGQFAKSGKYRPGSPEQENS
eukprot:1135782_1